MPVPTNRLDSTQCCRPDAPGCQRLSGVSSAHFSTEASCRSQPKSGAASPVLAAFFSNRRFEPQRSMFPRSPRSSLPSPALAHFSRPLGKWETLFL